MEFRYRAGEDRSRTPTAAAAASSASSGSAAARVRDGHGGDGAGYHAGVIGSAAATATATATSDLDDGLRRREAKERIRERILREEAEALQALALEAEVRHELMEERFTLLRSGGLARPVPDARAEGSEARAAPAVVGMVADSPSPIVAESMQPQPKADGSAWLPAKRKSPDDVAAAAAGASAETSTVSAATSSKKQRAPDLSCTVCGITTTCEAAMQDHLKGKTHRKKTAMLAPSPVPVVAVQGENQEDVVTNMILPKANAPAAALPPSQENSDVVVAAVSTVPVTRSSKKQKYGLTCTVCGITSTSEKSLQDHLRGKGHRRKAAALVLPPPEPAPVPAPEHEEEGDYTPTKFNMATNDGTIYEVTQMNGYVLCEVCNAPAADIVTMMCHLEGSKHTSKVQQKQLLEAGNRPAAPVPAAAGGFKKSMKGRRATPQATSVAAVGPGGEVKKADVSATTATASTVGAKAPMPVVDVACAVAPKEVDDERAEAGDATAAATVGAKAPTPQVDVACTVAPMEVDYEPAEAGDATAAMAGEEKSAADVNSSATLQGNEPKVAPPTHEVKIQVEGRMCTTVVRQADGTLSCGLCGVHGCDKNGILQHLYTRVHRARVHLAEEKAASPVVASGGTRGNDIDPVER